MGNVYRIRVNYVRKSILEGLDSLQEKEIILKQEISENAKELANSLILFSESIMHAKDFKDLEKVTEDYKKFRNSIEDWDIYLNKLNQVLSAFEYIRNLTKKS